MQFLVTVETEDGDYRCVVHAGSEWYAEKKAMAYYREEGETVIGATAEMFNTFEHGDPRDYHDL